MELQNLPKIQKTPPKMVPCHGTQRRRQRPPPCQGNTHPRRANVNVTVPPSRQPTGHRSPDRTEARRHLPLVGGITRRKMAMVTRTAWALYRQTGRWPLRMMELPTSLSKNFTLNIVRSLACGQVLHPKWICNLSLK